MKTAAPMVTVTANPTSEYLNPLTSAASPFGASGVPSKVAVPTTPAASVVPGFDPQSGVAPRYGQRKLFGGKRNPSVPAPTHTQSFNSNLMPPTPSPGASSYTDGSSPSPIANHIGEIQMSSAAQQQPDQELRKVTPSVAELFLSPPLPVSRPQYSLLIAYILRVTSYVHPRPRTSATWEPSRASGTVDPRGEATT